MTASDEQDSRILNRFDVTHGSQEVTLLTVGRWLTEREDIAIRNILSPRPRATAINENTDPLTCYEGRKPGEWYLEPSDGGYRSRVYEVGNSTGFIAQLDQPVTDLGIKALVKAHNATLAQSVNPLPPLDPSAYEKEAYRFDLAALAAQRKTMNLGALSDIVNSPCAYDRVEYRSDPSRAFCDEHNSYGKPSTSCDAALAHATAVAEELGITLADSANPAPTPEIADTPSMSGREAYQNRLADRAARRPSCF